MSDTTQTDDAQGGQGAILSDPHHRRADLNMLDRAVRLHWPVKKPLRQKVVNDLEGILDHCDSPDVRIKAAGVLVRMDGINVALSKSQADGEGPTINVGVQVNAPNVAAALQDPDYLEFLRARRLEGHCDTSLVRGDGEPQPVANGPASGDIGSGAHGHAHGNGRH